MKKRITAVVVLLLTAFPALTACSSGSSDPGTNARVDNLNLEDHTVLQGQDTTLDIEFSFATDRIFDQQESVIIALKLPTGIDFVSGTSSVDSAIGGVSVDPEARLPCLDGGELLSFNLDSNDLRGARDPSGPSDARLTLGVNAGVNSPGNGVIESRAGYERAVGACDESFVGEAAVVISVSR